MGCGETFVFVVVKTRWLSVCAGEAKGLATSLELSFDTQPPGILWYSALYEPENDQEIFQSYGVQTCSVTVQRFFNMKKNETGENTLQ